MLFICVCERNTFLRTLGKKYDKFSEMPASAKSKSQPCSVEDKSICFVLMLFGRISV